MSNAPTNQPKYEAIEKVMEFLIFGWEKKFITPDAIVQGTGLNKDRAVEAVRRLITYYGVLKSSNWGEYEVIDLEKFFEKPEPGCDARYHTPYFRR